MVEPLTSRHNIGTSTKDQDALRDGVKLNCVTANGKPKKNIRCYYYGQLGHMANK